MAKNKIDEMTAKAKEIQTTLKTVCDKIEQPVRLKYHNKFLSLTMTSTRRETFLNGIKASDRDGNPKFTNKQQHKEMIEFVLKNVKFIGDYFYFEKDSNEEHKFGGAEYEAGIRDLVNKIFKQDFDKEFEDEESESKADNLPKIKGGKQATAES